MIQFKNCYFWRATFSWDPVSSLFPEALALLQQSMVKSGGGMSVWELAALNLVMPLRKQSLGIGPPCISYPCLHWTGECLTQLGWWTWQRSLCPLASTLKGKHRSVGLGMGPLGSQSFKRGKPSLSCWHKSQGQHEEFMNQSCEMANTFFMPLEDVFDRACGGSSCKSLQPVAPKWNQLSWHSLHHAEALQNFKTGRIWSDHQRKYWQPLWPVRFTS